MFDHQPLTAIYCNANSLTTIVTYISTSLLITAHRLQNCYMLLLQRPNKFPSWPTENTSHAVGPFQYAAGKARGPIDLNLDLAEYCSDKLHDKTDFRANCSKAWLKGVQLYHSEKGFSPAEYLYIK